MSPMHRIILFSLAFLAQMTVGQYYCDVCGAPGFAPTLETKIYVGAQYWYCSEFVMRAFEFDPAVCSVVQAYAIRDCGCQDYFRQSPPAPFVTLTTMCNICGGPNGSDLHSINPGLENFLVGTGLGDIPGYETTLTCGNIFRNGLAGHYQDPVICSRVQESTRAICGCDGLGW